jgi:hypothetical protein
MTIADAPLFDVLHVAGGFGQQSVMDDLEIIGLIRRHADAGVWFSPFAPGCSYAAQLYS